MEIAFISLIIGLFLLIIDFLILFNRKRIENYKFYSNVALTYGFVVIIVSFIFFIYNMLILNYSFTYVYRFASNDMDMLLRLTATWSSREGSYFLWSIYTLFLYVGMRLLFRRFNDRL